MIFVHMRMKFDPIILVCVQRYPLPKSILKQSRLQKYSGTSRLFVDMIEWKLCRAHAHIHQISIMSLARNGVCSVNIISILKPHDRFVYAAFSHKLIPVLFQKIEQYYSFLQNLDCKYLHLLSLLKILYISMIYANIITTKTKNKNKNLQYNSWFKSDQSQLLSYDPIDHEMNKPKLIVQQSLMNKKQNKISLNTTQDATRLRYI